VALTSPRLRPLDVEPDWALDYWRSKVTEGAPGMPWLKIDVILDQDRRRIAPLAGGFASAGSATGTDAAATITTSYVILSFLGVEVGRWLREEPRSGATFGWGPSGSGAMAFVDGQGRLTLLDKERRQQGVVRAESVSYPAWSPDGGYIAYLEKTGRSKWRIASVALLRTDARLQ
jgi:hypothetical protein